MAGCGMTDAFTGQCRRRSAASTCPRAAPRSASTSSSSAGGRWRAAPSDTGRSVQPARRGRLLVGPHRPVGAGGGRARLASGRRRPSKLSSSSVSFPSTGQRSARKRGKRARTPTSQAGQLLNPPSFTVPIPFTHADTSAGDRDADIPAFLRLPTGTRPADGWPILLFFCGLGAYRTDHTPRTQAHVDHSRAVLSFAIPGMGDCPAAPNDRNRPTG